MTIILKKDEAKTIVYTGTGEQEEILFDIKSGYSDKSSVAIKGDNVLDDFVLQEKLSTGWKDSIYSCEGEIPPIANFGKTKGIRIFINDNVSGNIELEVLH